MSDILTKDIKVLKLNRDFWAIGFETIQDAFGEMCSVGRDGRAPRLGMDIIYAQREDGTYDLSKPLSYRPVSWEVWSQLPVRACDLSITTGRGEIRLPTVTVCSNFRDIPDKTPKFSTEAVRRREGGRCAVSGKLLAPGQGNFGHDRARSKGGPRTFDNGVYMEKGLNTRMGTKSFEEMGWGHVKRRMKTPSTYKTLITGKDVYHESQLYFVN